MRANGSFRSMYSGQVNSSISVYLQSGRADRRYIQEANVDQPQNPPNRLCFVVTIWPFTHIKKLVVLGVQDNLDALPGYAISPSVAYCLDLTRRFL